MRYADFLAHRRLSIDHLVFGCAFSASEAAGVADSDACERMDGEAPTVVSVPEALSKLSYRCMATKPLLHGCGSIFSRARSQMLVRSTGTYMLCATPATGRAARCWETVIVATTGAMYKAYRLGSRGANGADGCPFLETEEWLERTNATNG